MHVNDFAALVELLATPIDYADLVKRNVLKKTGARTYLILNLSELPRHAAMQISSMAWTKAGVKATFQDTTKVAQKLLARIDPARTKKPTNATKG